MNEVVSRLVDDIADRVSIEPDLDDFLGWTAGTLEYWIHIVASSRARRLGWASTTEVPYVTRCPTPGTKSNTKWADGAFVLGVDLGVLLEVKTIPVRHGQLGSTFAKVPQDLSAMVSLDWAATLRQNVDNYSGSIWAAQRALMGRLVALQLVLIHGPRNLPPLEAQIREQLAKGVRTIKTRFEADRPTWLNVLQAAFDQPPTERVIVSDENEARLLAWSAEIAVHPR